ncbi:MAG: mannose-1-phosphate guanylyltransferase [Candidatus Saccharimonadaceae bacterium]
MKNNNFCIIMSGGAGNRFWPYSNEKTPKQFLDFFGTGRTLLQTTFDRFNKIIPTENIFVVTNNSYADLTKEQLPELSEHQILLEPIRRNTAPCIAYATFRIQSINPDANIIVTPADHLILKSDQFIADLEKGLDFVNTHDVLLTLGVKPTRPETAYGYIQVCVDKVDGVHKVKTFTEKPNKELAQAFVDSGEFVWNTGIFIWNLKTILGAFRTYLPDIITRFNEGAHLFNTENEKEFIDNSFPFCPNISIDYGVLEKANNVFVIISTFGWSDLDSWTSLHDASMRDENNNVNLNGKALYIESSNNVIALTTKKLVLVQGLDNYIIAESDKMLMICKKDDEHRIKHFMTDVKFKLGDEYS